MGKVDYSMEYITFNLNLSLFWVDTIPISDTKVWMVAHPMTAQTSAR